MAQRDAGYTLIESLVAASVFALLLGALYQGISTGWRGLKIANAEDAAIALLAERLASAGHETPLLAGVASGVSTAPSTPGLAWQTTIRPVKSVSPVTGSNGQSATRRVEGYWVEVTVRWRAGIAQLERSLSATTIKLKRVS
jgi:prepilin-type N-terminal cleavage/methylation domain-containing protein